MSQATYLRTDVVPLAGLTGYPGNARRGDVPTILDSLCRTGQYRGIVARDLGDGGPLVVLAGNHTLAALAAHGPGPCGLTVRTGDDEQPCALCGGAEWAPAARCEVIECDDAAATRINLVDNRSSERGTYEETALAELLAGLGDDLGGTGYTDTDLSDLLAVLDAAVPDDPDDPYDDDVPDPEPSPGPAPSAAPPPAPAAAIPGPAPGALIPSFVEPGAPAPTAPPAPGVVQLVLAYAVADRDEVARLVAAARDGGLPNASAADIVLRALRTLVAVLDSRHSPDQVVTVAALTRAAGVDPA